MAFLPGERIAQVLDLRDYEQEPYLVLATRAGLVKKTRLSEYDSNRSGGLIAINLRGNGVDGDGAVLGDELVSARLVSADDDLLLVSRKGQSVRFSAGDDVLRPMGRATSGVTGMKFRDGDDLLAMDVVHGDEDLDVFVVFENGLAKRTPASQYRIQGRGGLGIKVARISDKGGDLVGALLVQEDDEVLVVMEKGKIVRSRVAEVRSTGRDTSGVQLAKPDRGDSIIGVARSVERFTEEVEAVADAAAEAAGGASVVDSREAEAMRAAASSVVQVVSSPAVDEYADPSDPRLDDADDDLDGVPSDDEPAVDEDSGEPGGEQR
jgi:DNA gyrase subunit A